jgi:hypothetical protein
VACQIPVITLALPRPAAALAAAHMSPSGAGAINRPIPAGTMTVVVVANGGNLYADVRVSDDPPQN